MSHVKKYIKMVTIIIFKDLFIIMFYGFLFKPGKIFEKLRVSYATKLWVLKEFLVKFLN